MCFYSREQNENKIAQKNYGTTDLGSTKVVRWGFPGGASNKEPPGQCRRCKRHRFNPWVGKIPWKKAQQPTAGFLPGESHRQRSPVDYSS